MRTPRPRIRTAMLTACAVAVVSLVAGCVSAGSAPTKDPNAALEVWTRTPADPGNPYLKLFDEFTKQTGIKIDYKPVSTDFDQQLQQRAASKNLPDVVINDSSSLGTYQSQGWVEPVDRASITGGDQLTESAWQGVQGLDGKYYGVPFSVQSFGMLIRKDWLQAVGDQVPQTWDDLVKVAQDFTTKDPDHDGKADTYGMLVPGSTTKGYLAWWAASYLWQAGGDIISPAGGGKYQVAINTPQSVQAVTWLRGLFCDSKVVQPGALTTDTGNAQPFFETGKAGIYLTGPYLLSRFDTNLGKDKYEVVPTPRGPVNNTVLAEGTTTYLMAGSARQDAQKKLAEFLITADAQKVGTQATGTGAPAVRLPVNKTMDVASVYNDPRWQTFADNYTNSSKPFPNVPDFQPFRQDTATGLNTLFATCGTDVQGSLNTLAATLKNDLVKEGIAQ